MKLTYRSSINSIDPTILRTGPARCANLSALALAAAACLQTAVATERLFTYTYEPETMPQGAMEFEQWVTLRAGRTSKIGEGNYNQWDIREEFEYGVTDNYTVALYLNTKAESYRNSMGEDESEFSWEGISLENIYNVLNPATHAVGLSLYLEGTYSGEEAEIEEKIILGQRHGDWKWAVNFINETEWEDNFHAVEGKAGVSLGLARHLGKNWALGLEARNMYVFPEYNEYEGTAVYVGPVVSYHQEKWWVALTVMPQVWGDNRDGVDDGNPNLDLVHNERVNARLLFGISF